MDSNEQKSRLSERRHRWGSSYEPQAERTVKRRWKKSTRQ
jgi:hypothetical protein